MLATMSPSAFQSSIGWPLEDPAAVLDFNFNIFTTINSTSSESLLPLHQQFDQPSSSDPLAVKKLNHNASERDRRKKINEIYSSLRSSLPVSDQKKRLSIPATVSRVIKYIPELKDQVEKLMQKKDNLQSRISKQGDLIHSHQNQNQKTNRNSFSAVSVNRLRNSDIVIQISTYRPHQNPLSQILLDLTDYGFVLLNASSSSSFAGLVIYNLHIQVERCYKLESGELSEKLQSLCERREKQSVYM